LKINNSKRSENIRRETEERLREEEHAAVELEFEKCREEQIRNGIDPSTVPPEHDPCADLLTKHADINEKYK